MARIIITINKQGETQVHVVEAQGSECTEITEKLEEKLGEVTDKKLTSEYYKNEQPKHLEIISHKKRRI
jgi:hypothetical protein